MGLDAANLCTSDYDRLCSDAAGAVSEIVQSPQQSLLLPRVMGPMTPDASPSAEIPANPYHVLQIRKDATPMEIEQSYKRLALWHHPGRKHNCIQERQRRLQVFELLAACYETLIDVESRARYDELCRELETAKLKSGVKGSMFIGGQLLTANKENPPFAPLVKRLFTQKERTEGDGVPLLSPASTHSESSDDEDDELAQLPTAAPKVDSRTHRAPSPIGRSLMDVSSSGSRSDDAEAHYTETTTNRLFGGPMSHLYKARNFEPFSDSFAVFEKAFGSRVFQISPEELGRLKEWKPLRATRTAGWKGSSETSPDGKTTVFTTSRVLHDRRLTRRETVTVGPSGKTVTHVTVTAEDIPEEDEDSVRQDACLLCNPATSGVPDKKETEHDGPCGDICDLFQHVADEFDSAQSEIYQSWVETFANPSYMFSSPWTYS